MADVIKDSFVELNNHTEVTFQRGRVVADFEINEAQRIQRVSFQRMLEDAVQKAYSGYSFSPGSNDDGYKVSPGGADAVNVAAGSLVIEGVRCRYAGSSLPLPPYAGGGTTVYCVYLTVQEQDVADPASLPKLGETTRRRKLVFTLGVSLSGTGGVPASSPLDLWAGGTKNVPLATVVRRTGDSTVLDDDITDLRKLLPSSLVAEMTRQENFQLIAVVSEQFESPSTHANYVVGAGLPGLSGPSFGPWQWSHDFWRSASTEFGPTGEGAAALIAKIKFYGSSTEEAASYGKLGYLEARGDADQGGGVVGTNLGALRVSDDNTRAVTDTQMRLLPITSDGGNGIVRLFETNPARAVDVTGGGPRSVVQTLNARQTITVGDGQHSFGDFSGQTAIKDAIDYFTSTHASGICRIYVKSGLYSSDAVEIEYPYTVILEGESPPVNGQERVFGSDQDTDGVTWEVSIANGPGITVAQRASFHASGIMFYPVVGEGLAGPATISSQGDLRLVDCEVLGPVTSELLASPWMTEREIGLYAERVVFTGANSATFNVKISSTTSGPATPGMSRLRYHFKQCKFGYVSTGYNVSLNATAASFHSIERVTFEDCRFAPPSNASLGNGIIGSTTADAFAGYMTVELLQFIRCSNLKDPSFVSAPVFEFRAGNGSGTETGIVYKQIEMRSCDWRVVENNTRGRVPWYIGERTGIQNLQKSTLDRWSIQRLIIEDTLFGFVPNATDPGGSNINGQESSLSGYAADYSAALTICAEHLVIRNVKFEGSNLRSDTSDILLAGTRTTSVTDLSLAFDQSGSEANSFPPARLLFFPAYGNDPTSRRRSRHVFERFTLLGSRASGSSAANALIYCVPGGGLKFRDSNILGSSEDWAIRVNAKDLPVINENYSNADFWGLTVESTTIDFVETGIRYDLPTSGSVDHISAIVLDKVKFIDVNTFFFDFYEDSPAANTNYHTMVTGFAAYNCVAETFSTFDAMTHANARFKVGKAHNYESVHPRNVTMIGNDFGTYCNTMIGISDALTPGGQRCLARSNVTNFTVKGTSPPTTSTSLGFETGYTAVGGDMGEPGHQLWTHASRMVHNQGTLYTS